ncbi:MAG: TetR/AcrR family transcriptional regulator [Eggerthellaceae bacterium]|nr:TetR/AcrR family transcriptional regulator [Eggerthellaceae bacterium]
MSGEARRGETDLRVVKSREAIQEAFESLLETTECDSITVSEIARKARVSRKTFYAHYSSVADLLREMAREIVEDVVCSIQPEGELLSIEEWVGGFARATLAALRDNPHLENNVVRCLPTAALIAMVQQPLSEVFEREMLKRGVSPTPSSEYGAAFFLGGLCSVYETWMLSDRDPAALDDAAMLIAHTVAPGVAMIVEGS